MDDRKKGTGRLFRRDYLIFQGSVLDPSGARGEQEQAEAVSAGGAPPFSRAISPHGDKEFSPCPREFKRLEAKRCPVPFPVETAHC